MKRIYLFLVISFIVGANKIYSQINPASSPYNNNGIYTVVADSSTVNNKKVVMYRPNLPPVTAKYPVFIFQPGANGIFGGTITVHSYDLYLKHLTTYGFVVLVIDEVSSSGMPNGTTFKSIYSWFKTKVSDNNHWLHNYADSSKVAIGGHSNGGVNASGLLIEKPSEIKAIVYFASYPSNNFLLPQDVSGYTGKVLDLAGSEDQASTPATCKEGYTKFSSASCKTWVQITGLAHGGFGDYVNTSQPVGSIGRANATSSVKHFLVSFMLSQFKNDASALTNFFIAANRPNTTGEFETTCSTTNADVAEKQFMKINLYPNPVINSFAIDFLSFGSNEVLVEIYNSIGSLLISRNVYPNLNSVTEQFNIEKFPKGIYFVKIKHREDIYFERIIKQ